MAVQKAGESAGSRDFFRIGITISGPKKQTWIGSNELKGLL